MNAFAAERNLSGETVADVARRMGRGATGADLEVEARGFVAGGDRRHPGHFDALDSAVNALHAAIASMP